MTTDRVTARAHVLLLRAAAAASAFVTRPQLRHRPLFAAAGSPFCSVEVGSPAGSAERDLRRAGGQTDG